MMIPPLKTGIDVLRDEKFAALKGLKVGAIVNPTSVDAHFAHLADLLRAAPGVTLAALFGPEHGIRGEAQYMVAVGEEPRDRRTGVPVHSLYGSTLESLSPKEEWLRGLDALVFDIQDVGSRYYTYIYTMALAMKAAARAKLKFVVLDRPNPIGGEIVEGALIKPGFTSFVGMYPIPARHGMTVGELAKLFNEKFGIGAELIVIKAENWRRSQWMDDTKLPWTNPSPNLRSLAALNHYPGTVYFEGTSLTEGRGTDKPFEQIGAAWLDAPALARTVNAMGLPGIRVEPITMPVEPAGRKFPGQTIPALRLVVTDRQAYRPVRTALVIIDAARRQHPRDFKWTGTIDRLTGSDQARLAIEGGRLPQLLEEWDREAAQFREDRKPYLLY